MKAVVFDIDGTLADISHRLHFIQQEPKDWDSFFGAMMDDKPIESVRLVCGSLLGLENACHGLGFEVPFTVVFCTGRPYAYKETTVAWLRRHILPPNVIPKIYMRKTGDRRPDDIVKAELIDKMRADGFDPYIVFEDRKRVVDMWRRKGITCLQCAEGDF